MATLQISVPDDLVPRVLTALRATYPDITADLGDAAAARAVLKLFLRRTVVTYERGVAQQSVTDTVATAESAAWTDTDVIT